MLWFKVLEYLGVIKRFLSKLPPYVYVIVLLFCSTVYEKHRADSLGQTVITQKEAFSRIDEASKTELARAVKAKADAEKKAKDEDDAADARIAAMAKTDAADAATYNRRLQALLSKSSTIGVSTSAGTDLAESGYGPSGKAFVDEVLDNTRICTVNTRRLLELHQESISAIK